MQREPMVNMKQPCLMNLLSVITSDLFLRLLLYRGGVGCHVAEDEGL